MTRPANGSVTEIGDEKLHSYNRVLLSSVVDGSLAPEAVALQDADWAVEHGVDLRLGLGAAAVDRAARTVLLTDGSTVDYNVAVLATGARPWLPPVDGLTGSDGDPAAGVLAFRTLDDCENASATPPPPGRPWRCSAGACSASRRPVRWPPEATG